MQPHSEDNLHLEIGHVLFIDIVGYSKLLIEEQKERLHQLTEIVLGTAPVREATDEQLVRLPTGDGMALVFHHSAEEPARCALEIAEALQKHPELPVRMGIHSGPVSEVKDVSGRSNIAGAGINMAQRVMDCGDAGHILLSQHVADDLVQYRQWAPRLHDLGECEVKHGVQLHLVNLYAHPLGNATLPKKFASVKSAQRRSKGGVIAALALVTLLAAGAAYYFTSHRTATPNAAIADKSIAVLPFENLSSDKENAYFADGVQDEILTNLAKIADLKVISRTSVMQYKTGAQRNVREIGQQLGVAFLVEGSVQRAAGKVRVNAQLIDARTDAHQWAQVYDRPLDDVFAIQSEIARAIADQLQAKLSPREKAAIEVRPTADVVAFEEYSRAKTLLLTPNYSGSSSKYYRQAIDDLNSAIARDPSFFEAYYQLVVAHDSLYAIAGDHTPERLAQAEAALQGAARLRPDAPETHLARATHLYFALRDYKGALAELEFARRGLSNDPQIYTLTGFILRRQGKDEEGLRELQRATELDPRNTYLLQQLGISYRQVFRYPEWAAAFDRILTITPGDVLVKLERARVDFYWKADTNPLCQLVARLRAEQPASIADVASDWFDCAVWERDWPGAEQALAALADEPVWGDNTIALSRHFGEGLLARAMHNEAKAAEAFAAARVEQEQVVARQKDYGPALCVLGLIDAALGKKEVALEEGKRAMELMPVEKDSLNGQTMQIYFAIIAAWVGEKDLALRYLTLAGSRPGAANVANYGVLKLSPFWEPLRGDPRFEKFVAAKAPK
ncbi:MAG: adenylate/guanylate cyclase domain-containing protein [Spartobacteria bacterium]